MTSHLHNVALRAQDQELPDVEITRLFELADSKKVSVFALD